MKMSKESMGSVERMRCLMNGGRPDRVPFNPFAFGFCARVVGFSIGHLYSDPNKSFAAQFMTKELYGSDANPIYAYASQGGWELGGEIKFPSGPQEQAPVVSSYPVQSIEDIEKVDIQDVSKAGAVPLMMEFSTLQRAHGLPATISCGTPFKIAANSMELSRFCRLILKEPAYTHKLLRKATDFCLKVMAHWVEVFGAENVLCMDAAPTESNQVISPKVFETFALPYTVELHEKTLAIGPRMFTTHVCGEQNLNLKYWQKVPMGNPGVMSFGHEVDLDRLKKMFGDKCVIAGNVEPARIQFGTPAEVYQLCKQAILKGKDSPKGYIFMPGCDLAPDTPPYNVYTMKKAVEDFGRY